MAIEGMRLAILCILRRPAQSSLYDSARRIPIAELSRCHDRRQLNEVGVAVPASAQEELVAQ